MLVSTPTSRLHCMAGPLRSPFHQDRPPTVSSLKVSRSQSWLSFVEFYCILLLADAPAVCDAFDSVRSIAFRPALQDPPGTTNDTLFSDPGVDSWVRPTMPVRPMIHHRIVSGLLIPLQYAENAKDLLLVGRDVLNGDFSSIS